MILAIILNSARNRESEDSELRARDREREREIDGEPLPSTSTGSWPGDILPSAPLLNFFSRCFRSRQQSRYISARPG